MQPKLRSENQWNCKIFHPGSPQAGLGIFNVVTFPNEPCTSASGLNGTCLTTDECSVRNAFFELTRLLLEVKDECCAYDLNTLTYSLQSAVCVWNFQWNLRLWFWGLLCRLKDLWGVLQYQQHLL